MSQIYERKKRGLIIDKKPGRRTCLMCRHWFNSRGPGNRYCPYCAKKKEGIERLNGALLFLEPFCLRLSLKIREETG